MQRRARKSRRTAGRDQSRDAKEVRKAPILAQYVRVGLATARAMGRLYAAARLYVNFFQPSFKLKEKRREAAKVIKRYHAPLTPYQRALAHPKVPAAVKRRLRDQYRSLDPVGLLAEILRNPGGARQSPSIVVPESACNPVCTENP